MEAVGEVLARRGGWATASELAGTVTRYAIAKALARGDIERIAFGIYALPDLPADTVAVLAYDGVLSHVSAAAASGLPLLVVPAKPHLILPPHRRPRPGPPAVVHWADVSSAERRERITSLARTVVDCSRMLPFAEALAVADAALATRQLAGEELLAEVSAMRGPGCPNARQVAAAATPLAGRFLESILRAILIGAGIDGFEPQVLVMNGSFRARVDLGHRQARLALEAEGFEFHGSRRDFTADCYRYDELNTAGWLVLRFTYEQIIGDPPWVASTVRAALGVRQLDSTYTPTVASRSAG
ncbi:type IV toxin-antitoxin system AbiEi family antitoxin domain-containing protein [Kribbella solani]|uniref:type IV toxin-antitoxin system AbiEi family antitoxin domain-containing protein n=1 Tax=Kribbella solani TaxID=236067 RepID=UPI0029BA145D|nr:type IV toxin-antitoxin system AbiEi family antitoxin domain-containing protein [Kribbella solani]MDX3006991.1 type IV toxin-antitoxin system AbiEi family antitoxin domain-containing protein [Kribbella solani]